MTIFVCSSTLSAHIGLHHRETDGASANDKFVAFLLESSSRDGSYCSHWLCSLHQLQLVEVAALASVQNKLISKLYSLTLLLRSSTLWARMHSQLHRVLFGGLSIRGGSPSASATRYAKDTSGRLCQGGIVNGKPKHLSEKG